MTLAYLYRFLVRRNAVSLLLTQGASLRSFILDQSLLSLLNLGQLNSAVQQDESRMGLTATGEGLDLLALDLLDLVVVEPPPLAIFFLARQSGLLDVGGVVAGVG
jgi:hypothetical protein